MKNDRKIVLMIVVALVLIALALFIYWAMVQPDREPVPSSVDTTRQQIIEKKAEKIENKVDIADSQIEIEKGEGETRADLVDKTTGQVSGAVIRNVAGQATSFVVSVTLPAPEAGGEYQAWLIGESASPRVLPMGNLGRADAETYVATYSSTDDLTSYTLVAVSLETVEEAEDDVMGRQLLEGELE